MRKIPLSKAMLDTASSVGMLAGGLNTLYSSISSVVDMFKSGEHSV
jgi:hypothetical protein